MSGRTPTAPCGKRCPTCPTSPMRGFESDGSWDLDSDSSGPQIDRFPRVRKGRTLRFCRQCGHHQYWGEGWCFGCGWVRSHRRWRTERFPGFGKGSKGKGKGASGTHRGKGSKSSGRWRDLGPNPQEPAPRQILHLRNQTRRHRPSSKRRQWAEGKGPPSEGRLL